MKFAKYLLQLLVSLFVTTLLVTSVWVTWFVDLNDYRSEIESLVKRNTDFEIRFNGELNHYFLDGLTITTEQLLVQTTDGQQMQVDKAEIKIALLPLFDRKLWIRKLTLSLDRLAIHRDRNGRVSLGKPEPERQTLAPDTEAMDMPLPADLMIDELDIGSLAFSVGELLLLDESTDIRLIGKRLKLEAEKLELMEQGQITASDQAALAQLLPRVRLSLDHLSVNNISIKRPGIAFELPENLQTDELGLLLSADKLYHKHASLGPFKVHLAGNLSRLRIALQETQLAIAPPGEQKLDLQAKLSAKAEVNLQYGNEDKQSMDFQLAQLDLTSTAGQVASPRGDYRYAELGLQARGLPLSHKGKFLDWETIETWKRHAEGVQISLKARDFTHKNEKIDGLEATLSGQNGRLSLDPVSIQVGAARFQGGGDIAVRKSTPDWRLTLSGRQLSFRPLLAFFNAEFGAEGLFDLDMDLQGSGIQLEAIGPGLNGRVRMSGKDMRMLAVDLNAIIDNLEKSHSVGLLDIGAYAIAGPAGALITKGTDYASLLESARQKGATKLPQALSELEIEQGLVKIKDVAFTTENHRIAAKGSIDLANKGALDLEIATIDPQGCPKYMETVGGTLDDPRVQKANILVKSVVKPVESVLKKVVKLVGDGSCEAPFYLGSVR